MEQPDQSPATIHLLDQRLGSLLADDIRPQRKALFAGIRALGLLGGRGWCGAPVSFLEALSHSQIDRVTCVTCLRVFWLRHQVPVLQAEQRLVALGHPPEHSQAYLLALARRLFDAHWKAKRYTLAEFDAAWENSEIRDHWIAVARAAASPPPMPSADAPCEHRNVDKGDEFSPDRCRDCYVAIYERTR